MYLAEYSRNAQSADRARRRIRCRGETPSGYPLWTSQEDELCKQFGNDYEILRKKLPNRSQCAIRCRCQALGLRQKRRSFTANDISRMRKLLPTATAEQLREAFPNRSLEQLRSAGRYYGIRKKRRPMNPTGIPAIDAIKVRCFELGYSMGDVDKLAKSKAYFRAAGWLQCDKLNYKAIARAVQALDGELIVRWREP